jgi:catechol-2,3-dioxygenase
MLEQATVAATVAVHDLALAREFYEDLLGLTELDENPGGVTYGSGDGKLFVYQSEYAGTNKATAASWSVVDIDAVVEDLKSRGVIFEQYDMPGMTREGDIHMMGTMKAAWFKDPSGNILNVTAM